MRQASARFVGGCLVAVVSLAACGLPEVATGGGGGGGSGSGSGAGGDASGPVTGKGCTIQTTGGAFLCTGISSCPSITVNQGAYSQCGFLTNSPGLDVECECSGYLCPLGAASTCADVSSLLSSQGGATQVCNQLTNGGCHFEGIPN